MIKRLVVFILMVSVSFLSYIFSPSTAMAMTTVSTRLNTQCQQLDGIHTVTGTDRIFTVVTPQRTIGSPIPLMVSIHGATGNAKAQAKATGFDKASHSRNFITVFPQARDSRGRIWDTSANGEDIKYILNVIQYMKDTGCVNANRIYVSGFSQGAMLTSQLACHYPEIIAGAAPIGGIIPTYGCKTVKPIPVIAAHGTADTAVYYNGGLAPSVALVTESQHIVKYNRLQMVRSWALRNNCATAVTTNKIGTTTTVVTYSCKDKPQVKEIMITVTGGKHVWFSNLNDNPKTKPVILTDMVLAMFKL